MDITLKEVKAFLEENKDEQTVKYLEGLKGKVNLETIKDAVENNKEVKAWHLSTVDAAVTKGIEGWQEKSLPGKLQEAEDKLRLELNPKETEEQKQLRALSDNQATLLKQLKNEKLLAVAKDKLTELKISPTLAKFYIGEDEDSTIANVNLIGDEHGKGVKAAVEEAFKVNGRVIHSDDAPAAFTEEQILKMSPDEVIKNYDKIIQ